MHLKRFLCLGLLVTGLGLAACSSAPAPQPTATATRPAPSATVARPTSTVVAGGVPVGFTEDGAPYRGDPNAPVTLLEFSEYL
jgi:hypothetical protein